MSRIRPLTIRRWVAGYWLAVLLGGLFERLCRTLGIADPPIWDFNTVASYGLIFTGLAVCLSILMARD